MKFPIPEGKNKIAAFFNILFIKPFHFGFIKKIEDIAKRMNLPEKILVSIFSFVLVTSGLVLLLRVHNYFLIEIPTEGGSFVEGLIGSPRFINPVLAISDADKDLVSIAYSGLLKTGENGNLDLDLAESYEVEENGTVYNFTLKDNVFFHDGKKITTDDILFTIEKILDPVIKSPKRSNWEGVSAKKINDRQISFYLKKPYVPFLNALTVGILPKHIWANVSSEEFPFSQFNINPVGSGPYKVSKITRNSGGIPVTIEFLSWRNYASGKPKIKSIIFKFFQNESALVKALEDGSIDSAAGLSQESARRFILNVKKTSLPRVFGVFFNQNVAPVFVNKEVREALDIATPKKRILEEVLLGFGEILDGPTPTNIEKNTERIDGSVEVARKILTDKNWKENADGVFEKKTKTGTTTLEFSLSTSDVPELKRTAEILQETWQKMGAKVSIKIFEAGDLSQNVIKPRKYDALLFGEMVGKDSDLFSFWHSSERNDPGLNISMYTNITVDKALENIQKETDKEKRDKEKDVILAEIKNDIPAIFLFSPYFLYIPAPKVKNVSLKDVSFPNERFFSVDKWFIETDKIWRFFNSNKQ